jgi:hypothetical protein
MLMNFRLCRLLLTTGSANIHVGAARFPPWARIATQAKEGRHGAPTGLEFYDCIDRRRGSAGGQCASCTVATDRRAGLFAVAGLCGGPSRRLERRSRSTSAATGALGAPPLASSPLAPPPLGLASPPLASPALGMASSPLGMAPSALAPSALVKCGAGFPALLFQVLSFNIRSPKRAEQKPRAGRGFALMFEITRNQTGRQRP